jgi:hypothetical protein
MTAVLPVLDEVNGPFWEGCRGGVLQLQRCACGHLRYPVSPLCPVCLSGEAVWEAMSGHGEIFSFVVFRHVYNEAWRERVPYVVALVRLAEGPTLLANVICSDPGEVTVGLRVAVVFEPVTAEITVPAFEPGRAPS